MPKILLVCDSRESIEQLLAEAGQTIDANGHEFVVAEKPGEALNLLSTGEFSGVYVASKYFDDAFQIGRLLQNEQILQGMPDGVVLLNGDNTILWGNGQLGKCSGR